MRHIRRLLAATAFVLVVGFGTSAFADTVTITGVGCDSALECFAMITPSLSNTGSCSAAAGQVRFFVSGSGFDSVTQGNMWKTALAAFLAGRQVVIAAQPNVCGNANMPSASFLYVF